MLDRYISQKNALITYLATFIKKEQLFIKMTILFIIYCSIFIGNFIVDNFFLELFQIVLGLFFFFLSAGLFTTLTLQWLAKRKFDEWEFLSISIVASILVTPLILILEFLILKQVYSWYPLANMVIFWFLAGVLLFFKKTSLPNLNNIQKKSLRSPLLYIFIFSVFFTCVQIFMYPVLPDLDPYKWLFKYTYQFNAQILDLSGRFLFGSFVFAATQTLGISLLVFLKYFLPFFFLAILPPAWMIARRFDDIKKQWLFLLFIFISPVTILYTQTAMPQLILIILAYFFVFFLLYAHDKSDDLYIYLAGIISLLSFFFHQAGALLFITWIIGYAINQTYLLKRRKNLFFFFIFIIGILPYIKPLINFSKDWLQIIIARIFAPNNFNILYPATYNNIDHNEMGWGSINGIIKFYAFHSGPMVMTILLLFLFMFFLNSKFRLFFKKLLNSLPFLIIILSFILFFTIAEILPRFPNLALLPDRAWIFTGIFSFVFLFIILKFIKKISTTLLIVFTLSFSMVIFGAFYINYLKKYLIPSYQLDSAKWIKNNLPENRLFISYGHKGLLPVYANSSLVRIPKEIYCENTLDNFNNAIHTQQNVLNANLILKEYYKTFLENTSAITNIAPEKQNHLKEQYNLQEILRKTTVANKTLLDKSLSLQKDIVQKRTLTIVPALSNLPNIIQPIPIGDIYSIETIPNEDIKNRQLFIYYAKENSRNPYSSRPYEMTTWGITPCQDKKFLFDLYPKKFKRVYHANDNTVIIWKIL